ncbi:hypothetical protein SLW70_09785 [Flavobacterium sp. NG2]|uniref:hypothetical protein n=1 Tax=Flavobacterium sp. NG2 TaxID=3097547 RepID=UPI002A816067|nr:hypothetical protein [Flavobacterium sp. NG2]WPR70235.1 hypothetical protein SLW70_09785 [Flavobacterium sp. NG2]
MLNGKYTLKEISRSSLTDSTSFSFSKSDGNYTFYNEIDRSLSNWNIGKEFAENFYFKLSVLNSKIIHINYYHSEVEESIRQHTLKYKLNKNGYVYLKNRNFKIIGIPYIFGAFSLKRNRITLNDANNLVFETSEFVSGGVALLMVIPIGKEKYLKIYERKE